MVIHNPKELAMFIRSYRKKQSLSQSDIGNLVGLKQSTVSAFERKPAVTKLDTLFRILSAANLEIHIYPKDSSDTQTGWDEEW